MKRYFILRTIPFERSSEHACFYAFQNHSKYSVCAYSKCGKYIAAGGEKGEFSVWDVDANKLIDEDSCGEIEAQCITAIDWNPRADSMEFAYTDNSGQFGLIENICESDENVIDRDDALAVEDDINYGDSTCSVFPNLFLSGLKSCRFLNLLFLYSS